MTKQEAEFLIKSYGGSYNDLEKDLDFAVANHKIPFHLAMAAYLALKKSVLQDWVQALPLRMQGTLLTGIRGCDLTPKFPLESNARQLVAALRFRVMVPHDPREVDIPGGFFQSWLPSDIKPSEFGHLPWHWVSHITHCCEVVGYMHPDAKVAARWYDAYYRFVESFHMKVEERSQFVARMTEDRIAKGNVVS